MEKAQKSSKQRLFQVYSTGPENPTTTTAITIAATTATTTTK